MRGQETRKRLLPCSCVARCITSCPLPLSCRLVSELSTRKRLLPCSLVACCITLAPLPLPLPPPHLQTGVSAVDSEAFATLLPGGALHHLGPPAHAATCSAHHHRLPGLPALKKDAQIPAAEGEG